MKTPLFFFGIIHICSFLLAACDIVCKRTVEDVATIQNMTGRQLSISICKGSSYGEVKITVPSDTNNNEISLGHHEGSEIRGGPTATCAGVNDSKEAMGISLSASNFGEIKLCYNKTESRYIIVEGNQVCSAEFQEQTSADSCTNSPP